VSRPGARPGVGRPPAPGSWPLSTARRPGFLDRTDLACATVPTDLFFPRKDEGRQVAEAFAVCRRCPVLDECRAWAVPISDLYGIVGGTTRKERQRLRAGRAS
jgi:WhiB family transcriptional regulator, redox-sensing transcriptional regulator